VSNNYQSNKVKISLGTTENTYNRVDAVKLTGSLTKTIIPKKVEISYNDLINKLAEITDAQVTSGVGTDEVLLTPTKLPPQGTVLAVPPPLMSISDISLGEKLLIAVSFQQKSIVLKTRQSK
jgi:hypothetical protein